MINVEHNAIKLRCTRHYRVTNGHLAELRIRKFMDVKRERGFRIRHVYDNDTHILELAHRQPLCVEMMERFLNRPEIGLKRIPWTNFFQKPIESHSWR